MKKQITDETYLKFWKYIVAEIKIKFNFEGYVGPNMPSKELGKLARSFYDELEFGIIELFTPDQTFLKVKEKLEQKESVNSEELIDYEFKKNALNLRRICGIEPRQDIKLYRKGKKDVRWELFDIRTLKRFFTKDTKIGEEYRNVMSVYFQQLSWKDYLFFHEGHLKKSTPSLIEQKAINAFIIVHNELIENISSLGQLLIELEYKSPHHIWIEELNFIPIKEAKQKLHNDMKGYFDDLERFSKQLPVLNTTFSLHVNDLKHIPWLAVETNKLYRDFDEMQRQVSDFFSTKYSSVIVPPKSFIEGEGDRHENMMIFLKRDYLRILRSYFVVMFKENRLKECYGIGMPEIKLRLGQLGYKITSETSKSIIADLQNIEGEINKMRVEKNGTKAFQLKLKRYNEALEVYLKSHLPVSIEADPAIKLKPIEEPKFEDIPTNLEEKILNEGEHHELIELAMFAYAGLRYTLVIECFEKLLKGNDLSDIIKNFSTKSVEWIKNQDMYAGVFGVLLFNITENTQAYQHGLRDFDVVYCIDQLKINEPHQISRCQGGTFEGDFNTFFVHRGDERKKFNLPGSISLQCKAMSLVLFGAYQI